MTMPLPMQTRTYRNWCIDSTRWQHFVPRDGDITIATPYKSDTTWVRHIVGHLVINDLQQRDLRSFGRWPDAPWQPISDEIAALDAMPHRRVMKTHLALDGLPHDRRLSYIYVGRDLRDIFMALWNHHSNYTPELWDMMASAACAQGLAMSPPCPTDIRDFYAEWIGRGWFEWESDGYPYWSATRHLGTWWSASRLENVIFVHFDDLLADLEGEIGRIATFLGLDHGPTRLAEIAALSDFTAMKRDAALIIPGADFGFRKGPATFFNRGTNGRWRDVLTEADLRDWRHLVARELPPEAAEWLNGPATRRERGSRH